MPESKRNRSRRRTRVPPVGDEPRYPFVYRCPARLIGAINEARFEFREPSRTSLVTKALEAYLRAKGIKVPA